jgi:hypothetical protein
MIYIAVHKNIKLPRKQFYKPIIVGGNKLNINSFDYLLDNEGENISKKNSSFSELTAMYFLYKNNYDETIGLCHYRRYFVRSRIIYLIFGLNYSLLDKRSAECILKKFDIIVPKLTNIYESLWDQFSNSHFESILIITKAVIEKIYPDYLNTFNEVMKTHSYGYFYNMFVANKSRFDDYSKWLFDVLFEVEKHIDTTEYNTYQMRVFGFLSERLFNVYLHKNKLKTKEVHVINTETTFIQHINYYIVLILLKLRIYKIVRLIYRKVIGKI